MLDSDTFTQLTTFNYPSAGGNANYIVFDIITDTFIISGYDGSVNPKYHVYDLTTYAFIRTVTTSFPVDEEIFVIALSPDSTELAMVIDGTFSSQY